VCQCTVKFGVRDVYPMPVYINEMVVKPRPVTEFLTGRELESVSVYYVLIKVRDSSF